MITVRVASEGGFTRAVLDAGCGTGENALHIASLGLSVLGVDVAQTAPAIARAKTDDRGIEVEFAAAFSPSNGWNVAAIEPDRVQTRYHDDDAPAWFATIKRGSPHVGSHPDGRHVLRRVAEQR